MPLYLPEDSQHYFHPVFRLRAKDMSQVRLSHKSAPLLAARETLAGIQISISFLRPVFLPDFK